MERPQRSLRRFEITVYRNKDGVTDPAQVPADSTVAFFAQGATVRDVLSSTVVRVWHPGSIVAGDILWRNGASSPALTVATGGVSATNPDDVQITMTTPVTLVVGDRLVRATPSSRPSAYSDLLARGAPWGQVLGTSIPTTAAGGGRAACYLTPLRFDYTVTVGSDVRMYPDAVGSFVMR